MEGTEKKGSYRRIDFDMRIEIAAGLDKHESIPKIAASLGVSPSTVRREILRNRDFVGPSNSVNREKNDCAHSVDCTMRELCRCVYTKPMLCRRCPRPCHTFGCPHYEPRDCKVASRAPFACNGCKRFPICIQPRWRYSAKSAQASSEVRAKESRCGIDMTEGEMADLVIQVREGLSKGQSIHHIFASRELPCSERSFYRYVEGEDFPIIALELPKKVRYRKRRHATKPHPSDFYAGRTYDDFMALPEEVREHATQGDSVIGRRDDDVRILSLHRPDLSFQLYFRLPDGTTASVISTLDALERACVDPETGECRFEELFGVILLDRGSEFDDIEGMERSCLVPGEKRCRVFFADPGRADQKGSCEKNHVELRKIIPKGMSMQSLTNRQLQEICSHVNSTIRRGCGNTTPFALAERVFPRFLLDALGLHGVPPEDVIATPGVLYDPFEEDGSDE